MIHPSSPAVTGATSAVTHAAPARHPRLAAVQSALIREVRQPVRRIRAAWATAAGEASRLKHRLSYQLRATAVEHFAAPTAGAMSGDANALYENARNDRFKSTVSFQKWSPGAKTWVPKTNIDLFSDYLSDVVLLGYQRRYVEQLGRTGIHVDHQSADTAAATVDRPLRSLDEHIATIGQMVACLRIHLELELAQKKSSRNTVVIAALRNCIHELRQEKLNLQQRTRPLLKEWLDNAHQIDEKTTLSHLIRLGQISEAELQAWRDNDFSVLGALNAFDAGMAWSDFVQLAGAHAGQAISEAQRRSIQYLLDAKTAMPAMEADDFKRLAPTLLEQRTPLDVIQLMSQQKIVQNGQTLPEVLEPAGNITKLGAGGLNTVYRIPQPDGTFKVFKGEGGDVASQGTNVGIGDARNGANLTGRTLVAAAVAQVLEIHSSPASRPVVVNLPEGGRCYGTLSDFVPGAGLVSGVGASASIPLSADAAAALQGLTPEALNGIAQRFGFKTANLDSSTGRSLLKLSTGDDGQFITPLDLNSAQVRESASDLGFWAAITGQVDLNGSNVKLAPRADGGVKLVSIDNDMSAGKDHYHPNASIAASEAHHQAWQQVVQQCVEQGRSGLQQPIELPKTIGKIQRESILAMTRERFLARYQSAGLDADQQNRAWARLQGIQYSIRRQNNDGTPSIPVATIEWKASSVGLTASSGIPKVISASLKQSILALDEATVRQQMFGALGPEEQAAGWSRVMAIQDELSIQDHIKVIDTADGWNAPAVTQAMGLVPEDLDALARKASKEDTFDARVTKRDLSIRHGILADFGVALAVSRLCAEGSADTGDSSPAALSWKDNEGAPAYFDSAAILKAALAKAAAAQEKA